MASLEIFFRNPFADEHIGQAQLLAYTTDHLERLKAAALPGFAARIAATEAALVAYQASSVADLSKLGQRKGRKQTKASFRRGLGARLGKIQGAVMAVFGVQAPVLQEIFPAGRRGFTKCADDLLAARLKGLAEILTAHAPELAAAAVADGAALQSEWLAIYTVSEAATGEKSATEAGQRAARTALQRELLLNVLSLALLYPGDASQLGKFTQESLLRKKRRKAS